MREKEKRRERKEKRKKKKKNHVASKKRPGAVPNSMERTVHLVPIVGGQGSDAGLAEEFPEHAVGDRAPDQLLGQGPALVARVDVPVDTVTVTPMRKVELSARGRELDGREGWETLEQIPRRKILTRSGWWRGAKISGAGNSGGGGGIGDGGRLKGFAGEALEQNNKWNKRPKTINCLR